VNRIAGSTRQLVLALCLTALATQTHAESAAPNAATPAATVPTANDARYVDGYDRLLPLQGGSNFRDLGGYYTRDGMLVRRGLLFRSGAMASLTAADYAYLEPFGFRAIVDLRSAEERDLYPNQWAATAQIPLLYHDYSMAAMMRRQAEESGGAPPDMLAFYRQMPYFLEPQLRIVFRELLEGHAPLVWNCSAGQDRTGVTSAIVLLALGVPRDVVLHDYLQSTRYRDPVAERGDVDLAAAAKSNAFAAMMLRYAAGDRAWKANPLLTEAGVPFLRLALDQVEQDFGSIEAFLDRQVGIDAEDLARLRERYLKSPFSES
jgi:protein-tyrosine phosphatase